MEKEATEKSTLRNKSIGVGEWCREVILAEVLALRMLYLNTVQLLGRGRELTTEDLRKLIDWVDREKQATARVLEIHAPARAALTLAASTRTQIAAFQPGDSEGGEHFAVAVHYPLATPFPV